MLQSTLELEKRQKIWANIRFFNLGMYTWVSNIVNYSTSLHLFINYIFFVGWCHLSTLVQNLICHKILFRRYQKLGFSLIFENCRNLTNSERLKIMIKAQCNGISIAGQLANCIWFACSNSGQECLTKKIARYSIFT